REFSARFSAPFAWLNRQTLLHIEWAPAAYEIRLNGQVVGYSQNGRNPADFNLTRKMREGSNELVVALLTDSPAAALESFATGREPLAPGTCYVFSQPTIRIRDLFTRTVREGERWNAEIGVIVKTDALNPKKAKIHYELLAGPETVAASGNREITLDMRGEDTLRFIVPIPDSMLWSARTPRCYTLRLKTQTEGRFTEHLSHRVGFRTVASSDDALTINGVPTPLRAVPALGDTLSVKRLRDWREAGYNLILLPPGGVPRALYDLCDREGFYVVEQAPISTRRSGDSRRRGGNPSNDPRWLPAYLSRIEESYHTAQIHPCVIGFSIADDSANGINLYEGYLRLKAIEKERPVIYPDAAGEWNSDPFPLP
ncbi:MAG: hypothetical protein K2H69_04665, partial [Alistipes sp.]|nr:hypothetical protein [Alistipes sp.]